MTDTRERIRKRDYSADSKKLIEKSHSRSKYVPKVRKKITREEVQIREYIEEMMGVCSAPTMSKRISKLMGKSVSERRIKRIKADMLNEAKDDFAKMTSFDAAVEAREEYRRMKNQAHQMILEAELIEDQAKSTDTKLKAGKLLLQAREAEDRMYKMIGLHQEKILHEHINILETEEWKAIQNGFLVYLTHVLACPKCGHTGFNPDDYFEFMDNLAKDPHYIDKFMSRDIKTRYARKKYMDEARELMREGDKDYVDVEAN